MEGDFENENVNETIEFGFLPNSPELILSQIEQKEMFTRKIGFNGLSALLQGDCESEEVKQLLEHNIFGVLIESMCEANEPIMSNVLSAFQKLSSVFPNHFDEIVEQIPFDYLLKIDKNPEIIEFFSNMVNNSDVVPQILLSLEPLLTESISNWLQSTVSPVIKATLSFLTSLAMFNHECYDFNIAKPVTDSSYNCEIRALALNLFLQIEPSDEVFHTLMEIGLEDNLGNSVYEVFHDLYLSTPSSFDEYLAGLIQNSIKHFSVSSAAIFIADCISHVNEEQRELIIEQYFKMINQEPEHAYCLYVLLKSHPMELSPEHMVYLATQYAHTEKLESMESLEHIIAMSPEFLATEECQNNLLKVFSKPLEFSARVFEFILDNYKNIHTTDEIMEAMKELFSENETELSEMALKVSQFQRNHQ